MPIDPEAVTGAGGLEPTLAPFTAEHTPQVSATTSLGDEMAPTMAPRVVHDPDLTIGPPADDPDRTISPPGGAHEPGKPLPPGTKLGTRYTVLSLLGQGGMGAVYKAYDDELGVAVAIKTILPGPDTDEYTRRDQVTRFKSELLLARQVTHKNVVRIHDLGEFGGLKCITMSYVAGETLTAVIKRVGQLPVPQTLALARQIADGMAAAHEVGVVHRDLKPDNVMVTPDGQALIMDFGIASSSQGAKDGGQIVGTISYMAPEQATGKPVDARADIYAYGLICYDMLLGRQRFKAHDKPMDELRARFEAAPPALRKLRADVPLALESIVMRAVQPAPEARFADVIALRDALSNLTDDGELKPIEVPKKRWPAVAASVALTALVAAGGWWQFAPRPEVQHAPVSVLVADFENKTGDPVFNGVVEQALGLGIEGASFVTAYPRRDALRAAAAIKPGSTLDTPTARLVALREGVGVILTGDVASNGAGYRITAHAMSGADDKAPEIGTFTADAADRNAVLDAVGRLAGDVRESLGDTKVGEGAGAVNEAFTAASLEAAQAYTAAQELQFAGKTELAIDQYKRALALDPDMGRAYSGMAAQYANLARTDDAEGAYQEALARIDRMTDREKFRTRGSYYLFARKPDLAAQEYRALVQAYPADTTGLSNLALASFYRRDMGQALEQGRRAAAILAKNVLRRSNVALYAMYAGKFDDAITEADAVHALNPNHVKAFVAKALALAGLGRMDEARQAYDQLASTGAAGESFAAAGRADLAHYQGRLTEAVALLTPAIAADLAAGNAAAAASKRVALAEVHLARGDAVAAAREAEAAAGAVDSDVIRTSAGFVLAATGRAQPAGLIAGELATRLEADPQAYGRLVLAELALAKKDPRKAVEYAREAQKLADTWPGRVILGRAYLGLKAYPEAYSELDAALKRHGEATAAYLDDVPTLRYLAPVYYYMGLAQEGLRSPAAAESFKTYIDLKAQGDERGFLADAGARLAR